MTSGVLTQVADIIDPDAAVDRPELATPTTLAAHLDSAYQVRAHLTLIGEELAKLEAGVEFDRLMINTPPRVGKTRLAVEWFCFWWLIRHPTHRIIVASYDDSLAQRAGKHIRALIERYGARYGLVLEHGSTAAKDWSLSTGGGVRSVGIGSGITGHDGDVLIFDDPTKSRAEAESVKRRDAIYDWWSAEFSTRVVPGTRILGIQTPWHPDDLRVRIINQEGRVGTGGRWREVIMAALTEDPADPLGRAPGEPLPHPKIAEGDTHRLQRWWERIRSAIAVRDWRALYQCDPKAPEGQLVSWDLLRERRCYETATCAERGRAGVSVDPSGGGRDTAGIVAGHLDADGRCVFTHDRSGVMSSADWGRAACDLAVEVGADFICYETNYGGDQAEFVIKTAWNELRREQPDRFSIFVPRIIGVHSRKGKLLRAEPIAQQWKEDRCRTGNYLPDLESEWATWVVGGDSPGRIDASVHLAYELLPVPSTGDASLAGVTTLMDTDLLGSRGLWGR
jgi:hypothetical protein